MKKVAELWKIVGWEDTIQSLDKIACCGCDSLEICGLGVRECAVEKGLDSCGKCADYSCDKYLAIFKNNEKEAAICKEKFSKEDYELFQRAFFSKKERLDKIHQDYLDNF